MQPDGNDDDALPRLPLPRLNEAARAAIGDRLQRAASAQARRRRWTGALALGGAAVALGAVVWLAAPTPLPPPTAGSALSTPAQLRTGPGEYRLWSVGERAVVFASEQTTMEVLAGDAGVRLIAGSARFVVSRSRLQHFVVRGPVADAVVLGTEFDVGVAGTEMEVEVVQGHVEVRNGHGSRLLWNGERAHVRDGERPRMVMSVRGEVSEHGPTSVRTTPRAAAR